MAVFVRDITVRNTDVVPYYYNYCDIEYKLICC